MEGKNLTREQLRRVIESRVCSVCGERKPMLWNGVCDDCLDKGEGLIP